MTSGDVRYKKQIIDYLGFLEGKLRDLHGISTLAYELIQNADDVKTSAGEPGASKIIFDVCDDALAVENDGVFRKIDFERMQRIASGGKRAEAGTTGAFGIGFISVFQVTDYPEIFSAGQHWIIRPDEPEDRRIREVDAQTNGTRFVLPWACDPKSRIRQKLRIEPIDPESSQLTKMAWELVEAVELAALFLKQLKELVVKRNGITIRHILREVVSENQVMIQKGTEEVIIWNVFQGDFGAKAETFRQNYSLQIEKKRRSQVQLAVPDEPLEHGRLFAVLPTDTSVSLPFHINADFFPTTDRKRIILGDDFQSQWNRAAIHCAARTLADKIKNLPDMLNHKGFWQFLTQTEECWREAKQGDIDRSFASFWEEIRPLLSDHPIVWTLQDGNKKGADWSLPSEARLLSTRVEQEAEDIFVALGIPVVHKDLRPYFSLMQQKCIGVSLICVRDILDSLSEQGLSKGMPLQQGPPSLRTEAAWQTLYRAFDSILDRRTLSTLGKQVAVEALRSAPIAITTKGLLFPPAELHRGDETTQRLFPELHWFDSNISSDTVPGQLIPTFGVEYAVNAIESLGAQKLETRWREGDLVLSSLYRWLENRKGEIEEGGDELKGHLLRLPIGPDGESLKPLAKLFLPGDFTDPLGLSGLLDLRVIGGRRDFLRDLGVRPLTFTNYAREQVPRLLQSNIDLSDQARDKLIRLLARRLGEIRDDDLTRKRLANLPLIKCKDGKYRFPREVYLNSDIINLLGGDVHITVPLDGAVRVLYEWLGVTKEPRPRDLLRRIKDIVAKPPTEAARKWTEVLFGYLVSRWTDWDETKQGAYVPLQQMAWLPAEGVSKKWFAPDEIYASYQSYLFESQAKFLDLPISLQRKAGRSTKLFDFLGIRTSPEPEQVVRHLLVFCEANKPVNQAVYRFLNDNAEEQVLDSLKGKACLLRPDGQYVRPDHAFWGDHPFGHFRYRLGSEMRRYSEFLERLDVRESPAYEDFLNVLLDISEEYGRTHLTLDEEVHTVVMNCWEALSG